MNLSDTSMNRRGPVRPGSVRSSPADSGASPITAYRYVMTPL